MTIFLYPEQQLILDNLHEYDLGWIHDTIDKHWSVMKLVHRCTAVELIHVESCKK